jgi:hypothetical protein
MTGPVNDDVEDFISALVAEVPDLGPLLDEHLADYDELLAHVLFADLTRWVVARATAQPAEVGRVLSRLETACAAGTRELQNLVFVSFVENLDDDVELPLGPCLRSALDAWRRERP